ncbi:Rad9-domain-containing protein [Paraphysoderma sedebokerense]|nr:Rad9-domain-containing protein [Paraphysoderma sedebokerense]
MEAVLPGSALKTFAKFLQCLLKIGDELFVEARPHKLQFSTVNSSKSAFAVFQFAPKFFDFYEVTDKIAEDISIEEEPCVQCKLLLKPVYNIFKLKSNVAKNVEKCIFKIEKNSEESRLSIELKCLFGITKIHKLNFSPCTNLHAIYSKHQCPHRLIASPQILSDWLSHFHNKLEEMTVSFANDIVRMRSFVERVEGIGKALTMDMQTEINIDPMEFDMYEIQFPSNLTFSMKEFKAVLTFAESMGQTISGFFERGGTPLMLAIQSSDLFLADFVLATVDDQVTLDASMQTQSQYRRSHASTGVRNRASGISTIQEDDDEDRYDAPVSPPKPSDIKQNANYDVEFEKENPMNPVLEAGNGNKVIKKRQRLFRRSGLSSEDDEVYGQGDISMDLEVTSLHPQPSKQNQLIKDGRKHIQNDGGQGQNPRSIQVSRTSNEGEDSAVAAAADEQFPIGEDYDEPIVRRSRASKSKNGACQGDETSVNAQTDSNLLRSGVDLKCQIAKDSKQPNLERSGVHNDFSMDFDEKNLNAEAVEQGKDRIQFDSFLHQSSSNQNPNTSNDIDVAAPLTAPSLGDSFAVSFQENELKKRCQSTPMSGHPNLSRTSSVSNTSSQFAMPNPNNFSSFDLSVDVSPIQRDPGPSATGTQPAKGALEPRSSSLLQLPSTAKIVTSTEKKGMSRSKSFHPTSSSDATHRKMENMKAPSKSHSMKPDFYGSKIYPTQQSISGGSETEIDNSQPISRSADRNRLFAFVEKYEQEKKEERRLKRRLNSDIAPNKDIENETSDDDDDDVIMGTPERKKSDANSVLS